MVKSLDLNADSLLEFSLVLVSTLAACFDSFFLSLASVMLLDILIKYAL